jgi:hypothetical protein
MPAHYRSRYAVSPSASANSITSSEGRWRQIERVRAQIRTHISGLPTGQTALAGLCLGLEGGSRAILPKRAVVALSVLRVALELTALRFPYPLEYLPANQK